MNKIKQLVVICLLLCMFTSLLNVIKGEESTNNGQDNVSEESNGDCTQDVTGEESEGDTQKEAKAQTQENDEGEVGDFNAPEPMDHAAQDNNTRASSYIKPYWKDNGKNNRYLYDGNGNLFGSRKASRVIDVSQFQSTINWNAVKASGKIDAAIIRIGWGWGGVDTQAKRNISECNRLGIPYTIYLFSYANTASEATSEAAHTYSLMKSYGVNISMPIYYDLETWSYSYAGAIQKNPSSTTTYVNIVNNYINYFKARGISANVYSYRAMLNGVLAHPSIWKYTSWMAAYTTNYGWSNPYYSGLCGWQYSSSETVSGINGRVDMSAFLNFTGGIDTQNHTGLSSGKANNEPTISYQAYCQNTGWLNSFTEPNTAGTTGRGLSLYQLKISSVNESKSFNLIGKIYIAGVGWKTYEDIESEDTIGVVGKSMRVVNFDLNDQVGYRLMYRVHSAHLGWQDWVNEGSNAGNTNYDIQAIEFKLVKDSSINYSTSAFYYQTYVTGSGWQKYRANNGISGTTGNGKPIEAIRLGCENNTQVKFNAKIYCKNIGWMNYQDINDSTIIGNTGKNAPIQAINLSTDKGDGYAVQYRTHVSNVGWTSWVNESTQLGQANINTIEAIQIRLVKEVPLQSISASSLEIEKNHSANLKVNFNPSNTTDCKTLTYTSNNNAVATVDSSGKVKAISEGTCTITITSTNGKSTNTTVTVTPLVSDINYKVHQQTYGWTSFITNGSVSGVTGKGKRLEALQISISDKTYSGNVTYRSHVQTYGWESSYKKEGTTSGTTGKSKRIEAIQIKLSGEMSKHYDVYYCVHSQHLGWLGWAKNGQKAGSQGYSYRCESIKIVIVKKGDKAPTKISHLNAFYSK